VEAVQGSVREPRGLVFADVILRCKCRQGCQEECDVYDGQPGAFGEGEGLKLKGVRALLLLYVFDPAVD
jgi:hypothetical protein